MPRTVSNDFFSEQVREFHESFRHPVWDEDNEPLTKEYLQLRCDLIAEETNELIMSIYNDGDMENADEEDQLKELADLLYVAFGLAVAKGWDIEEAFARVHESNMSKLGADGHPIYREDGKVLKGPNYFKPDLGDLV